MVFIIGEAKQCFIPNIAIEKLSSLQSLTAIAITVPIASIGIPGCARSKRQTHSASVRFTSNAKSVFILVQQGKLLITAVNVSGKIHWIIKEG